MNALHKFALRCAVGCALSVSAVQFVPAYAAGTEIKTVDVRQGKALKEQGAILLDVREPDEYDQGHAPDSVLIPLGQLKNRLHELRALGAKPVAVICRSGRRSALAAEILGEAGFTKVYNVQGGMIAWEGAALPTIKGRK